MCPPACRSTAIDVSSARQCDAVACQLADRDASRLLLFSAGETPSARSARAGGVETDGRFTLVQRDAGGWIDQVSLLDGQRVWNTDAGCDLVNVTGSVVEGLHVEDYRRKD